jgi:hypothetical protein
MERLQNSKSRTFRGVGLTSSPQGVLPRSGIFRTVKILATLSGFIIFLVRDFRTEAEMVFDAVELFFFPNGMVRISLLPVSFSEISSSTAGACETGSILVTIFTMHFGCGNRLKQFSQGPNALGLHYYGIRSDLGFGRVR